MIKISAIICTFKRPDYLRHALRSLCEQSLSREAYEIIVVDNAVEAEAERIVAEFQDGKINLRYVPESRVGLSRARNTGLQEARGRYVAYIDDDARAEKRWLESLVETFERTPSGPAVIGGRVWLDWHGEKPAWVPDDKLSLYTYVDLGDEARAVRENEYLVGANLAFEKEALSSIGGFDPNLGRQGSVLLSGEEPRAIQELINRGHGICYQPGAVVWHSVDATRKKPGWLLRRMFWDGASQPLLDPLAGRRTRLSIVRGMCADLRQCARWSGRALLATVSGKKIAAWQSLLGLSQRAGRVRTQARMLALSHE